MSTYWQALARNATDPEQIEEAIARILALHDFGVPVAVWAMMPKTQSDTQTISDAIAAAVAAHEADTAAHLGATESLQSHKASGIIDHVAGSVVRDKIAWDRFVLDDYILTLDAWVTAGSAVIVCPAYMDLYTAASPNAEAYAQIFSSDLLETQSEYTHNPNLEVRFNMADQANVLAYILMGSCIDMRGFGFKFSGDKLYACYFDIDDVEHTSEITGIATDAWHRYRIECESITYGHNNVAFIVDGVERSSFADVYGTDTGAFAAFYVKTLTAARKDIGVGPVHYDADYM